MGETQQNLLSSRFYLSSFRYTDIDEITRLLQNPAVVQNLAKIPVVYTRKNAVEFYDHLENLSRTHPEIARLKFTIREKGSEKPVGRIDVMPQGESWRLGYWLGMEYWGQGIMTWACTEILKVAREHGITKIRASPKRGHWASRKVLEKNRFRYMKDEKQYFPSHGQMYECWVFEVNLDEK
jgi:[ribosomal protein S5]-alanine N-acetyltransferase